MISLEYCFSWGSFFGGWNDIFRWIYLPLQVSPVPPAPKVTLTRLPPLCRLPSGFGPITCLSSQLLFPVPATWYLSPAAPWANALFVSLLALSFSVVLSLFLVPFPSSEGGVLQCEGGPGADSGNIVKYLTSLILQQIPNIDEILTQTLCCCCCCCRPV